MINNVRERNPMPEQPREVRCSNFDEVALGYTEADAIREAMRCLNCRKQPCAAGCPIHQRIPEFIAKVAEGDFEAAYDIITVRSTMPSICGRVCPQEQQCEKNCKKKESIFRLCGQMYWKNARPIVWNITMRQIFCQSLWISGMK